MNSPLMKLIEAIEGWFVNLNGGDSGCAVRLFIRRAPRIYCLHERM